MILEASVHLANGTLLADGTWFQSPAIQQNLLAATGETLAMVAVSTLVAAIIGLLLGMALVATQHGGLYEDSAVHWLLSAIVNIGRAIPFIIVVFLLIDFSRWIAGTGHTWQQFAVPLTLSAAPYFARLVESNLMGVDQGKMEAVLMTGASRQRVLWGVLVREALPALIQSITILAVTIVGYSAMAGTVGGGGLGAMAQTAGYYNRNYDVLTIVVVLLVAIVMLIQWLGDMLSRLVDHR